ncbi:MAG: PQQ-binding-like beta-propeller repeat protein [Planctomycetia bacterium]|nr:PQQ-binding-like beta-propeller repeat protein [Planctomycetia bacterium]
MSIEDLLFVGFNGVVVALEKQSGERVWTWECPKPSSRQMVAILVEEDCVFASSGGYTYCLEGLTGQQLWYNPLKGLGSGVPCLATAVSGLSPSFLLHAQTLADQTAAASSGSTATT